MSLHNKESEEEKLDFQSKHEMLLGFIYVNIFLILFCLTIFLFFEVLKVNLDFVILIGSTVMIFACYIWRL